MSSISSKNPETPRIYAACLAAYNSGRLHGAWIDANQEPDVLMADVQTMLKASPIPSAEEYAIHDYEGFYSIKLSEWEGLEQICAYAALIEEYGQLGSDVYSYYGDVEEVYEALTDRYAGCYQSIANFAEELTSDTTQIPDNLAYYIDYERMARDMEMSGNIITVETASDEIHIFWSH